MNHVAISSMNKKNTHTSFGSTRHNESVCFVEMPGSRNDDKRIMPQGCMDNQFRESQFAGVFLHLQIAKPTSYAPLLPASHCSSTFNVLGLVAVKNVLVAIGPWPLLGLAIYKNREKQVI